MSEDNRGMKQDENESSDGSDYSECNIIDVENGSTVSDSDQSVSCVQNVLGYVASGTDVQTSDILVIEHLWDEIHAGSPDEILISPSDECQINLDEENGSQLECTYFDSSDLCRAENLQKLQACSFSQNPENFGGSLNTSNKKDENIRGEGTIDTRNKTKMKEMSQEEISSTENPSQKSQVIEKSCIQIFKFAKPKLDGLREKSFLGNNEGGLLKCPDYESDEFADVEDNAKDSSDNNESTSDARGQVQQEDLVIFPAERYADGQGNESMKRIPAELPIISETGLLKEASNANPHVQSYNIGASCSHDNDKGFSRTKNEVISEVADFYGEASQKDPKLSAHKASSLKMKTKKLGMRKDKCNVCRVRLGLCAIKCRCGGYYCAKHRYDKEHNCTFDYKSMGAEEIRKNNPRIVAEKVRKL